MKRVLKWTVPVDDQWHPIGGGEVALVAVQGRPEVTPRGMSGTVGVVTVWTVETFVEGWEKRQLGGAPTRGARVYGTGHDVPDSPEVPTTHLGSCQDGPLVWHLFGTVQTP